MIAISTGIVKDWPSPRSGRIYSEEAIRDILDMSLQKPPRGVIGRFPSDLDHDTLEEIQDYIARSDTPARIVGFEDRNGELFALVESGDEGEQYLSERRWRAALIIEQPEEDWGKDKFVVKRILSVPAFWLEELREDELP